MPEVKRFGNIRLVIHSNDHIPVHLHAIGPECEAKFEVDCDSRKVKLLKNYRGRKNREFQMRELEGIKAEIISSIEEICETWSRIHGD